MAARNARREDDKPYFESAEPDGRLSEDWRRGESGVEVTRSALLDLLNLLIVFLLSLSHHELRKIFC